MSTARKAGFNVEEISWVRASQPGTREQNEIERNARATPFKGDESPREEDLIHLAVIDERALVRECLTSSLRQVCNYVVSSYPDIEAFVAISSSFKPTLLILCLGQPTENDIQKAFTELSDAQNQIPVVVVGDSDDAGNVLCALNCGARGYIPASTSLDVAIEAIRLVKAGGVFVPASTLLSARAESTPIQSKGHVFTPRQAEVVEALCRGKANKIIAFELCMRESTVKVHVRNIMRKLKARNRTEVAFLASNMLGAGAQ